MNLPPPLRESLARRMDDGVGRDQVETLAEETPVALLYNGQPYAVMMATPADLHDFALGFSLSEGVVASASEVRVVDVVAGADGISLHLAIPQQRFDVLGSRGRNLAGRTGCGLCGSESLRDAIRPVRTVQRVELSERVLWRAFEDLLAAQPINARTGAVHAAAVMDADDRLHVREDVGRHNAIDKAIGAALQAGAQPRALLVTSRASYEVVHKAAQVGIGLVAAISAPTALAVRLADQAGLTLLGFARGNRHTRYSGFGTPPL
ncbi:formate dehydrogenase accessory sulfurtransferase FdhD [Arenimonas sp. MALMAid1274]|uniref:formate dehydrogenase accessory sulfurtransferase FdhD n=1 Tax=Arenimonas sp. MALMAid1274 TaxID=3411630 RepID=UPI003B9E4F7C